MPLSNDFAKMTTTLDQLSPGQTAQILRIDGTDGISSRLREMGFISGQPVQYIRRAPMRGPVKCGVAGSRVAVRPLEARRVHVELGDV